MKAFLKKIKAIVGRLRPGATGGHNMGLLYWCGGILTVLVVIFSVVFHIIMRWEEQTYSWLSGLYWVLVTMTTLGFGDITFTSDAGRFFSVIVVISGMLLLLMVLPFTFVEFVYSPFVKAQREAQAPRSIPAGMRDHVVITHFDEITASLIRQLDKVGIPSVVVVSDVKSALELHDIGVRVVVADLSNPEGFERCGFERAGMVAATGNDFENTSIVFTARQMSKTATIVSTVAANDSVDILRLAGASHVIQLGDRLGSALARRTIAADAQAHVIGNFDRLLIAEAMVAGTPLQGKTLANSNLRELSGVNVVGFWRRGVFTTPSPAQVLEADTMLVLAGTKDQIKVYNELFCIYRRTTAPCVIIGAGRVGRSAAKIFTSSEVEYRIVEKEPSRIQDPVHDVLGSAADLATLKRAGIESAPAVLITTHEDAVNIYLTIYCRKLRPDIQIVVRANNENNVARLHSAGADVVMSYAAMGSNIIYNLLHCDETLLVADGLGIFRASVPQIFIDKTIRECDIRERTGCSIIALERTDGLLLNPLPDEIFRKGQEILLIGRIADEEKFFDIFGGDKPKKTV